MRHTKAYCEEFYLRPFLTRKQRKLFDNLDEKTLYKVVEDRQGGEFGMYRVYNTKQWVHQALEWLDSDDEFPCDKPFIDFLVSGGEKVIAEIDDFWDITFKKTWRRAK